jgi:hypothetical protein
MPVSPTDLEDRIKRVRTQLSPSFVEAQVRALLRQCEDVGGGGSAARLVQHLMGGGPWDDVAVTRAYERLKPALGAALEQIPALTFFEGDC